MGKHSKNQTTRPFLTADERRKLSGGGGDFGRASSRLGSDSQLTFEQCRLCLGTLLRDAVASPCCGALFCRVCILEHLLTQRAAVAERLGAWERECAAVVQGSAAAEAAEHASSLARFVEGELGSLACGGGAAAAAAAAATSARLDPRSQEERRAQVVKASPWVPGHEVPLPPPPAGQASSAPPRPDALTRCPVSGHPLRAKELLEVRLSLAAGQVEEEEEEGEEEGEGAGAGKAEEAAASASAGASARVATGAVAASAISALGSTSAPVSSAGDNARYACACCAKPIVFQRTCLLRACGHVVCTTCIMQVLAKTKECSVCSQGPLKKQDFLALQGDSGTGKVGHAGTVAEATSYRPSLMA